MSRIGKRPISIPAGVTVTLDGQTVSVKGPKGELSWTVIDDIVVDQKDGALNLTPRDDSTRARAMWGLSRSLVDNMVHGVTHAEYIRAHADGRFYFLEIAARVGGAFISDLVQVATGINLWREWARLEVADLRGEPYVLPQMKTDYAGSVLCLAKTAEPDTSSFNDPEIVLRMKKLHHAGLIVRSPKPGRVAELLDRYSREFAERFLAKLPPPDKPTS